MSRPWDLQSSLRNRRINGLRSARLGRFESLEGRRLLAGDMMDPLADDAMVAQMDGANSSVPMAMAAHDGVATAHVTHDSQAAHPAAMALVSADQATHTVVASGNWSDPSVWSNGTLPVANARIVIPQGVTLTVDSVMTTEFKTIKRRSVVELQRKDVD